MAKIKTAISIESDLLDQASDIAQERNISRSQVVSQALEEFIQRYRNNQLLEEINAAFDEVPDEDEEQMLHAMREKQKKLWEEDGGWK